MGPKTRPRAAVRSLFTLLLASLPTTAQTSRPNADPEPAIARLRAVLTRKVKDDAGVAARRAEVRAWLAQDGTTELGDRGFLRALARCDTDDVPQRAAAQDEVLRAVEAAAGFPVPGFEQPARTALLLRGLRLAEAGAWDACREYLPVLLRHYPDHAAVYWLMGRRGRDHGSEQGKVFLREVIVRELLLDPTLDDTDRVVELRRLWDVEYTGPRPFAHLEGPGLTGGTVTTAVGKGRVLLVDYWATWCVPCMHELPNVVATWQRFKDQGLVVVSVNLDVADSRAKVEATSQRLGLGWPQIFDGKGWQSPLVTTNRVTAIPATFLIDKKGRVRWTGLEGTALAQRVAELLAEPE